ncbi:MAG: sugar phosphate nucleotidyltransferase [Candidatus Parvarchaeota archaeon]
MKSRVSFTIDPDIIGKLDSLVDNISYRSKSEAVESILKKYFESQKNAVILCGGDLVLEGSTLYRPLLKIGAETVIENIIGNVKKGGFRNIIISGKSEILKSIFLVLKNGEGYGVDIKYFDDNELKGDAKALEKIKDYITSTTLFIPGDSVFSIDLKDMLAFHNSHNSVASVAVLNTASEDYETDVILTIRGNKITSYKRIESKLRSRIIPTPIMLFEPSILKFIPPGNMSWRIHHDLLPLLAKEELLSAYLSNGEWTRVRSFKDLEKARDMLSH